MSQKTHLDRMSIMRRVRTETYKNPEYLENNINVSITQKQYAFSQQNFQNFIYDKVHDS